MADDVTAPSPDQPDDGDGRRRWYSSLLPRSGAQVVVGVLAVMFLAGALGYLVGTRDAADGDPPRGSVDVGFLYDMTAHHDQAVQIAHLQLLNGEDPDASTWAREILRSQSYEIGLMEMRLGMWGHDPADRPEAAMEWMGMETSPEAMPGMADAGELDALRAARGGEADALFYALMIDHHAGGVAMARAAAARADDEWVRRTAATMAAIQEGEITEMAHTRDDAGLPRDPAGFSAAFPDAATSPDRAAGHEHGSG